MTTVTESPTLSPISSALRRVMTLSISLSPILTTAWAMIVSSLRSTIFPRSWLRAEMLMDRFYTSACFPPARFESYRCNRFPEK